MSIYQTKSFSTTAYGDGTSLVGEFDITPYLLTFTQGQVGFTQASPTLLGVFLLPYETTQLTASLNGTILSVTFPTAPPVWSTSGGGIGFAVIFSY